MGLTGVPYRTLPWSLMDSSEVSPWEDTVVVCFLYDWDITGFPVQVSSFCHPKVFFILYKDSVAIMAGVGTCN